MIAQLLLSVAAATSLAAATPKTPINLADNATPCELTVVLECGVGADGAATACKVVSEDPNTLGAGASALSMSHSFHLTPRDNGAPVLLPVRIQTGQCTTNR